MSETHQEEINVPDLNGLMAEVMGLRTFHGEDALATKTRQNDFDHGVKLAHDLGIDVTPYIIYVEDVDIRSAMIDPTEF